MQYKVFGCKVNKYYTDKWLNSDYLKEKNGIFVASCVVTDKAKKKWIKFVKESFQGLKENEKIYISGCGAFKSGEAQEDFFEIYPELEQFQGKIELLGEDPQNTQQKSDIPETNFQKLNLSNKLPKLQNLYTKKFVLIQGGCDSFCTFCLTVVKRGRHFYRDKDDILKEILDFEKTGGKEVVLTGVNLSAWGLDTTNDVGKSRFAELLTYLLDHSTIPRLRISSLGPEFISDEVLKVFENTRIYPHFHFSIQSGSTKVLKEMRRHYDGDYIRNLLKKLRIIQRQDLVDISIGADIIVGFPGESEKDFMDTYNLVQDLNITKLHAFPFSPHEMGEHVPAGNYDNQVDDKIKKQRLERLMILGENLRNNFIKSQKGKKLEVLIEVESNGNYKGWTQNYIEVTQNNFFITGGIIAKNQIIKGNLL